MLVEITDKKTGRQASTEVDIPTTFADLVEKYGEDLVALYASRGFKAAAGNSMRVALTTLTTKNENGEVITYTEDELVANAVKAGQTWTPPEPRIADPAARAVRKFDNLDENAKAAVVAYLKSKGLV